MSTNVRTSNLVQGVVSTAVASFALCRALDLHMRSVIMTPSSCSMSVTVLFTVGESVILPLEIEFVQDSIEYELKVRVSDFWRSVLVHTGTFNVQLGGLSARTYT